MHASPLDDRLFSFVFTVYRKVDASSIFFEVVLSLLLICCPRACPQIRIVSSIIVFRIVEVGVFESYRKAKIESIERDFIELILGWTIV